ncbi:MAG: tripartite tricarboxylate transporter substrate-binding protein [Armatimonadota bacterium]|nr:tripartite tricarboxylate transporter substrate-binding protein [Armatimonadota bacterium]
MSRGWLAAVILALACAGATVAVAGPAWQPTRAVELVPAGDPGGGLDLHARIIAEVFRKEKIPPARFIIINMGGAGGNTARSYLAQKRGDPHVLVVESNRAYLAELLGTTRLRVNQDFLPVVRLTTDYVVWAVRKDSRFRTARDVLEAVRQNPGSVSFGVGTVPSNDQFHIIRAARSVGARPAQLRITAFRAGGDLMAQLLGGHVEVISTGLAEAITQFRAGEVRLLVVSAPRRLPGELAGVPVWKDFGLDLVVEHWRGVFAPPGIPPEAMAFWVNAFARMRQAEYWEGLLRRYNLFDAFLPSDQFARTLEQERERALTLLKELGVVQ